MAPQEPLSSPYRAAERLMGFLHPSFLAGLGALALPLLFHLLRRSQVREETFPTLRFFRLIQKRSTFLFRVGHLLLLLLRLSILVLITLLFVQISIPLKEKRMAERRGEAWSLYVNRTRKLIPRVY